MDLISLSQPLMAILSPMLKLAALLKILWEFSLKNLTRLDPQCHFLNIWKRRMLEWKVKKLKFTMLDNFRLNMPLLEKCIRSMDSALWTAQQRLKTGMKTSIMVRQISPSSIIKKSKICLSKFMRLKIQKLRLISKKSPRWSRWSEEVQAPIWTTMLMVFIKIMVYNLSLSSNSCKFGLEMHMPKSTRRNGTKKWLPKWQVWFSGDLSKWTILYRACLFVC
jgi:hypothetical protein